MFEKEAKEYADKVYGNRTEMDHYGIAGAFQDGAEFGYNKANEELEEKISVLLSCKNCPENKDGLICQKEYEGKCLAQKIQYIKELKEENAELKEKLKPENCLKLLAKEGYIKFTSDQLTKAKKIIKNLMVFAEIDLRENEKEYKEAEQFLKEVV